MKLAILLKGFAMGLADLVPGVSGGTIAFITGIYDKLIQNLESLINVFPKKLLHFLKEQNPKNLKTAFTCVDFPFLLSLGAGILLAILTGSQVISYLLEDYALALYSLFTGLIIASLFFLKKEIPKLTPKLLLLLLLGFVLSSFVSVLSPLNLENPSLFYLFFSGFIALSAMLLPGISGSFLLLYLGVYETIITALSNPSGNLALLGSFILGLATSIVILPKIISYQLRKRRGTIMTFLFGLVLGSLVLMFRKLGEEEVRSGFNLSLSISCIVLGLLFVMLAHLLGKTLSSSKSSLNKSKK
jgi:putative membrane protein